MPGGHLITKGETELDACLAAFAAAPRAGALLCDIDGTISAIVARPGDAAVPEPFREVLAALTERLGLVAFVTGRALEDGRRMLPPDGAAYLGAHAARDPHPCGGAGSQPGAGHLHRPLPLRSAAAAAVHQGHGHAPPAGRRRLPCGHVLRRRPDRRDGLQDAARLGGARRATPS